MLELMKDQTGADVEVLGQSWGKNASCTYHGGAGCGAYASHVGCNYDSPPRPNSFCGS